MSECSWVEFGAKVEIRAHFLDIILENAGGSGSTSMFNLYAVVCVFTCTFD